MVEKKCQEYGAVFTIARRRAEQGRGLYCSKRCSGLGKARNHPQEKSRSLTGDASRQPMSPLRKRQLQQSFCLEYCPWQSGAVPPVCCDGDYYTVPDAHWGY